MVGGAEQTLGLQHIDRRQAHCNREWVATSTTVLLSCCGDNILILNALAIILAAL